MKARFLHFADCHLGYWQYNNRERYNDFGRAFIEVIEIAKREKVDFVILAGDLFHKRSIEALTLNQAMNGLERLKAARIPCIAVEGNHELAYHGERIGWVEMLALRELIILLDAEFVEGEPRLAPYKNRKGSYFDPLPGLRVHGLSYAGSGAARAIEAYARVLAAQPAGDIEYTIFVTHAGVEGVLADQSGGLTHREWSVLRPHVDYLALGHVHKPFEFDGWIYNPGSTETNSITEAIWPERGYYLVEVDTERPHEAGEPKHTAELKANPRRDFHRFSVKTDLLSTPEELYDHCRELLERKARDLRVSKVAADKRPVIELQLTGILPFDRAALDLKALEQLIVETFNPLLPMVKNHTQSSDRAIDVSEAMSRPDLERYVLNRLLENDGRFRDHSERWAELALSLKGLALSDTPPAAILEELGNQMQAIQATEKSS
jgi:DNA repair exonuclease SbcCD nuclease subunit